MCRRDGHWFLKLLQAETGRMEGWCQQMEQETKDNQLSEEGKAAGGLTTTTGVFVELPPSYQLQVWIGLLFFLIIFQLQFWLSTIIKT